MHPLILGKGQGLVTVLHEPSRIEKTLITEGIAKMLKKSFYVDFFYNVRSF